MSDDTERKDEDPTVKIARITQKGSRTIAYVGLIGTLITAIVGIITVLANPELLAFFSPEPTLTPTVTVMPIATNTETPSSPTIMVSPSLVFTDTPALVAINTAPPTIHPTSIPGNDWKIDCIDLTTWEPYLAGGEVPVSRYCTQLAAWGITAQDGEIIFNTRESTFTAKEYGLSTSLPLRAKIEFSVNIQKLQQGEIWIGILDGDRYDRLEGYIFVIQPNGSMDFRDIVSQDEIVKNEKYKYAAEHNYPTKIVLDAGKISVWVDGGRLLLDYPLPFSNRQLFFGYRSLPSTNLDVSIYNLSITSP